jgi:DNA-binding protein YbaB
MGFGRRSPDDWDEDDEGDLWLVGSGDPSPRSAPPEPEHADVVTGTDPAGAVTVAATPEAEVVAVTLAEDWKRRIDPRALHSAVVTAANAATAQALARRLETTDLRAAAPQPAAQQDDSPLTRQDVTRLLDAVTADLGAFTQRLSEVVDQPVTAESPGHNVSGSAQRGQVLRLGIDPAWASAARNTEIEAEIKAVLTELRSKSTPQDLAGGPRSRAIDELNALASDPQRLLRRLGLPS